MEKKKIIGLVISLALSLFAWCIPTDWFGIAGMTVVEQRVIALFIFAAAMWITEPVPIWTTSVMVMVLMLLTSALGSMVDIGVPLFQRYALNRFVALGSLEGFPLFLFLYLAVILVSALLNYISCIYGMKIEVGVSAVE